jgi:predicted HTH transcriptional regulator
MEPADDSWDQKKLKALIEQKIEESLNLEFKDGAALENTDAKKREITKDVSAFANSDGGTLIYGISQFQDSGKEHLAEKISPVKRETFLKNGLSRL